MSALSRGEWQERMETGCVGGGFSPGRPFQSERVWTAVGPHPETSAVLTWCLASTHTRTQLCWEDLRAPRTPTVPSQSQGSRPSPREQDKRARQTGEPTGRGAGEHAGARRLGPARSGEHVNRWPARRPGGGRPPLWGQGWAGTQARRPEALATRTSSLQKRI